MDFKSYEKYIPLLLRVSIGFLWIWMAVVPKFIYPSPRVMMVSKSWVAAFMPITPTQFVYGLGVIELILGTLLIVGLWTRLVSGIQIVFVVIFFVGLFNLVTAQPLGITSPLAHLFFKDIPLIAGNLVLIITGGGAIASLDNHLSRRSRHKSALRI